MNLKTLAKLAAESNIHSYHPHSNPDETYYVVGNNCILHLVKGKGVIIESLSKKDSISCSIQQLKKDGFFDGKLKEKKLQEKFNYELSEIGIGFLEKICSRN